MFECSVCGVRDGLVIAGDATSDVGVLGGIERGEFLLGVGGVRTGGVLVVRKLYILLTLVVEIRDAMWYLKNSSTVKKSL